MIRRETEVGVTHSVFTNDDTNSEVALSQSIPICPKCGLVARFLRRSEYVYDMVPVECGCGWRGRAMETTHMSELDVKGEKLRQAVSEWDAASVRCRELAEALECAQATESTCCRRAIDARRAVMDACGLTPDRAGVPRCIS